MPLGGTYDTGTVAVTNGSATVVGTGVFWPDVLEGDHLVVAGLVSLILSVDTGTNTITLMKPYAGATNATASYQLVKMSWLRYDPSTVMFQVRALLAKLNDAGLIYYTDGTPDPAIGENGDLAINTSGDLWAFYTKESGAWVLQTAVVGPPQSIADYGAVTDGFSDDIGAVNAAIAAAVAQGGGEVIFPIGTTFVSGPINVYWSNIALRGAVPGGGCIIKSPATNLGGVISMDGIIDNCSVLDLTIDQGNPTLETQDAILIVGTPTNCSVRRVKVVGIRQFGIVFDNGVDCVVDDCDITKDTPLATLYGIGIGALSGDTPCKRFQITNNRLNGVGIRAEGFDTILIANNIVRGVKSDTAILTNSGNYATVSGNTVSNGRPGVIPVTGLPVGGIRLGGAFHLVSDNIISDFDGPGLKVDSFDSVYQNNLIFDCARLTSAATVYRAGILVDTSADRNLIKGNRVSVSAGITDMLYCYNEGGPVSGIRLADNHFDGASVVRVNLSSAATLYRPLSGSGSVTLTPGATTTTVSSPNTAIGSRVFLSAATASAAITLASGTDAPWILQSNITAGQFIISHTSQPATDRTFYYLIT